MIDNLGEPVVVTDGREDLTINTSKQVSEAPCQIRGSPVAVEPSENVALGILENMVD